MAVKEATKRATGVKRIDPRLADAVTQSYGRCCLVKEFFDDFYDVFANMSPRIATKFAHTDFAKQKQLLRRSITFVIMDAKGSAMAQNVVKGLGESHSRKKLDIAPDMYQYWLNALLQTIRKHDPQINPQLETAWRSVLEGGIAQMIAAY